MHINKLYLRAFGKFTYKRIYLGKKLNIIYGENETGKSTIHSFIESVLYGFDDDVRGGELYKKYKPWDSNLYKGSMTIDGIDSNKYLVAKDFLLGTTKVFNKELEDDDNPKTEVENVDCPGLYFFNMSKASYRNTASIKQLGNKTDKELSIEVKNKIINLSRSKDESISIERILSSLNSIKNEAGSEDNPKTLLGQYSLRLKDLNNTKETVLNSSRQVMFLGMERKKFISKIQEINIHVINLNKKLLAYELSVEKDRYLKVLPVKAELDEINKKITKYTEEAVIKEYSDKDYQEASKLSSELNIMLNKRHDLRNEKDEARDKLNILEKDISNKIEDTFDIIKINHDFNTYEINKTKIDEIRDKIKIGNDRIKDYDVDFINEIMNSYKMVEENNSKIDILKILFNDNNYNSMQNFVKSQKLRSFMLAFLGTLFMSIALVSGYAAYYYSTPEYYGGVATVILGIISYIMSSKSRRRVIFARKEIESIECQHADYNRSIQELNKEIDDVLDKIECKNLIELKNTYKNNEKNQNVIKEKLKLLEFDKKSLKKLEEINVDIAKGLLKNLDVLHITQISKDSIKEVNDIYGNKEVVKQEVINLRSLINEINESLNTMDKEILYEEKRLNAIINSNNMKSIDEFKEMVELNETFIELKNKKLNCESMLNTLLGKTSIDELKRKTENVITYEVKGIDIKEQQIAILKLNEEKNELQSSIDNIDKEIDEIEKNDRNMASVEEEIEFYEDKIKAFKERVEVAEIASNKILEISDSIKGDFMPLLRKSISENFSYVTGGKYKEVLIDEHMNISVVSEENKDRNIYIDSLSGGTLDQLYLSLRISLSNILSGNQNIPIILDDSFVQYDSSRLKKSLDMLLRESERRQVILFTCQEREIEFAKNLNIKFNLIKL